MALQQLVGLAAAVPADRTNAWSAAASALLLVAAAVLDHMNRTLDWLAHRATVCDVCDICDVFDVFDMCDDGLQLA